MVDFLRRATKKSLLTMLKKAKNIDNRLLSRLFEAVMFKEEYDEYSSGTTGFVRQDGTTPLTANWDVGAFDIRAADVTADSGGVFTDTITEITADAGVTVEGVALENSNATVPSSIDWSGGNTVYVPLAGDIQTYVTAAAAGDTLVLASGVYTITSTITVNKQLNIRGQGSSGFVTSPVTPSHGTLITSSTASVTAFSITSDNVRIADLSVNLTGASSVGISTSNNLQGIVFNNIDVIVDCSGPAVAFTALGTDVVMRDLTYYATSSDGLAAGALVYNNASTTRDAIIDCFSVTGTVQGAATYAYAFACLNQNVAKDITLNINASSCIALAGTPLDVAIACSSTTTNNATVNAYLCTFDGADYDAWQDGTNAMNIGGSVLVNNTTSGTITYRAAMASALGAFSTSVTTDAVNEFTGAAGVTIDGLLIQDSNIAAVDYSFVTANDGATDVTAAELETLTDTSDADSLHTHGGLATHIADTTTHGTSGDVVGTSDTQTLTNKTLQLDDEAITMTVSNDSGAGMSKGDLCYISGDSSGVPQVTLADADAEATASKMLVCINETIANGADGDAVVYGWITGLSGLTASAIQYIHTTAGDFTETAPSGSGDIVRVAGYAMSTTEIFFNPGASWVEIA